MDCWLARDGFGMLQLHHSKPFWDDKKEDWISGLKIGILSSLDFEFKDITFENSPVKVEINLKNSKNMENKKINVAELLKDCPKGMELDCPMYNNLYLNNVEEGFRYPITCYTIYDGCATTVCFTEFGAFNEHGNAKCVIFPKGKNTWEGFVPPLVFKDGDILYMECSDSEVTCRYIFILSERENSGNMWQSYCFLDIVDDIGGVGGYFYSIESYLALADRKYQPRFATEEEKKKLFKAIEKSGYKWNAETKTLEKLPIFFNDGDIVVSESGSIGITLGGRHCVPTYCVLFGDNDFYAYRNNKVYWCFDRLANEEEKQKLFKAIKENGYRWNSETKTLKKRKFIKDGDILAYTSNSLTTVFIHRCKKNERNFTTSFYVGYTIGGCYGNFHIYNANGLIALSGNRDVRPATEEEKQRLFKAIKESGYRWNEESKTLEELPKFKGGDILMSEAGNIVLLSHIDSENTVHYHCIIPIRGSFRIEENTSVGVGKYYECILANEHQKQRMYDKIKSSGYKYNQNTNKLEKLIESEFKVGDIVQDKAGYKVKITEVNTEDRLYGYESLLFNGIGGISFDEQDSWELVVPKFKVGDRIKHVVGREEVATVVGVKETYYNLDSKVGTSSFTISLQHEWELVPNKFDISSLVPYESKVLARNSLDGYWKPAFWGAYVPKNPERHQNRNFLTTLGFTRYCIPFEGNEALTGTTDDCDDFYKTWED